MLYTAVASLERPLKKEIELIGFELERHLSQLNALGVLLTGSCSEGKATYRSDIDLLVLVKEGPLTYGQVCKLREQVERVLGPKKQMPLPVEVHFVLPSVFETKEPAMKKALAAAQKLCDPSGALKKGLESILKRDGKL